MESGKTKIADGKDQMSDAVKSTLDKRDELYKTEDDLKKQLKTLKQQKKSLEELQSGLKQFQKSDEYKGLKTLSSGISDLEDGIRTLEETIETLEASIETTEAAGMPTTELQTQLSGAQASLATLQGQRKEAKKQLKEANAAIAKQFAGLSEMKITVKTYEDIPAAAAAVGEMVTQVNAGIKTIESALKQVEEGKTTLSDAIDTLNANAAITALQMADSSAELATAASSLESAQTSLDEAKDSAKDSADLNGILSVSTISDILKAQNFDMPAGYAYDGDDQYLVRVGEAVTDQAALEDLVLMDMKMDDVRIIRLSDVADVTVADNSGETYTVINGNPGIALSMEKQTGYSTGEVTDRLLDRFERLEKEKEGLHLTVLMNQGVYIDLVVQSVLQNMIVGAILAIIVLLLFLKDFKPTVVIACSIPLSVITAIVLMYFTGITMNIISLSGLTLGIGMLVDNSIVVIENIYRLRGEGYSVKKAAVMGASQVTGAIVASTLTTVSVYAPIIFTEGITRQLFVDLALTIAFTLLASLIVALTFVPATSSAVLKKTRVIRHPWFDAVKEWYGRVLETCLRWKAIVFLLAVVLLAGSAVLAFSRGMAFFDMEIETGQLSVTIGPKDEDRLTFAELTDLSDQVIGRISDIEGIDTIAATAGGNTTINLLQGEADTVSMYLLLDEDKERTTKEIADEILSRTKDLDCEVTADASSSDYSAYFGSGISVEIKGPGMDTLQELAADVAKLLEETPGTTEVNDGLDDAADQLTITVDKEKAAKYGYTVAQVYQLVLEKMASNTSATTVSTDVKDYRVYVQTEEQSETKLSDIEDLSFTYTTQKGKEKEIPLTKIAKLEHTTTLSMIYRDSQVRYVTASCGIDEDHNITLVADAIQKKLDQMTIPEGYSVKMTGEDETINDAMRQMVLMLTLAVIFIYLIMVAQFQSLVSPFIIMFSIPLAFTGGFLGLFLCGQEVSVIAMLGFVMLAGLIVNNGIVLIDYINQARREGMSKHDAIIASGKTRVRPILMTVLTTVLAMSTTALGMGDASDMMKPMAITIIGGLLYGTILTLVVIPCIYDAFHKEKSMVEEEL